MAVRRAEQGTAGADEGLQGLSTSPFAASSTPSYLGLRIPSFVNDSSTRYLFLLDTRIAARDTHVLGFSQGLHLGMDLGPQLSITTQRPVEFPVVTPGFRFSDGANVSWHLVKEPMIRRSHLAPKRTNTDSFAYLTSDTPALLYNTFTSSLPDPQTGAPDNYPLTLTSYTPPQFPIDWQPIAGLKSIHDIRYPWDKPSTWNSIDELVEQGWRISLYASVLQTDPTSRPGIIFGPTIATDGSANGGPPEEDFIYKFSFPGGEESPAAGPIFWRVYGRILTEDGEAAR